jgi:hypothetical protein
MAKVRKQISMTQTFSDEDGKYDQDYLVIVEAVFEVKVLSVKTDGRAESKTAVKSMERYLNSAQGKSDLIERVMEEVQVS